MNISGVMSLLRPLLLDIVPSVQQTAALALGRLANYSDDLAEAVVKGDILPQLVYSLAEQNRFYKKAAAFVLRAVAKHSPPLAQVRLTNNVTYFRLYCKTSTEIVAIGINTGYCLPCIRANFATYTALSLSFVMS